MDNRKSGMMMGLLMGLTMSFSMSLIGNLTSGRFSFGGFLTSFGISFLISLLIGRIVPMNRIAASLINRKGLDPRSLRARILESLVTGLTYTPLMTFFMILLTHHQAVSHGAQIPVLPMLIRGELIQIPASILISFLILPVYKRLLFKKNENRG